MPQSFFLFFLVFFFLIVLVDDEKKFKKLFKKYFEKYATITIENLDQQFTAKLKKILNKLNKDIASQINDIIKEQLDLTENEKYKLRQEHFNKISKAIRDAEKAAKRSIGLKSFNLEQQIRKEILGSLGYGETFKRLCGDVKKIVVKDFYIEQKDYEIMKKDAVADVKEKVEMELCSPGEIKKMKNRLKETLLKELKEEQMVCFLF